MLHDGSKSQETKVVDLKRETDKSTMKVGDFKALLSLQNTDLKSVGCTRRATEAASLP